jgi:pseudo-rSAM protein
LLLENESQFDTLDKVLQLLAGINYNVIPIYSGSNKLFFENNVYLTEEDILELKPELKTIHTNQILNSNFFGKLFITPDGKIYENINGNCIGQINNSNLAEIVYNNILNGVCRFKTRSVVITAKIVTILIYALLYQIMKNFLEKIIYVILNKI